MSTSATPTATPATNNPSTHQTGEKKSFSPLVQQFLDYLQLEKHFSDYTVKSYGADLIQFGQFLAGEIGPVAAAVPAGASAPKVSSSEIDERAVKCEPLVVREFLAYLYGQNY